VTASSGRSRSLAPTERIRDSKSFIRAYRKGRRVRIPGLTIILVENFLPYRRLGISAGKKIGGAVRRNRAKRIIRELFRKNKEIFPPGHDLIFIPDREFVRISWQELETKLFEVFCPGKQGKQQQGIICKMC